MTPMLLLLIPLFALVDWLWGRGDSAIKHGKTIAALLAFVGCLAIHWPLTPFALAWLLWRATPKVPFPSARIDPGDLAEGLELYIRHITLLLPVVGGYAWFVLHETWAALAVLAWAAVAVLLGFLVRRFNTPTFSFVPWSEALRGAAFGLLIFGLEIAR